MPSFWKTLDYVSNPHMGVLAVVPSELLGPLTRQRFGEVNLTTVIWPKTPPLVRQCHDDESPLTGLLTRRCDRAKRYFRQD
jgi:hypothetical protein